MRNLRRLLWAAVAAVAAATPAAAQQGGGQGQGGGAQGGATGGNLGNFQTLQLPTAPTVDTSGGTTGGVTAGGTGVESGLTLSTVEKAPTINPPSSYAKTPAGMQASNFLAATYANPYYSGILASSRTGAQNPGGFGAPTFGAATGARAGVTGTGARGGVAATKPGGQLVQLPRQIAYTAQLKFAVPTTPAPRLQADIRGLIDRADLTVPVGSVQVQVDGSAVVLRGAVRDGDEARLVEGLVRLTPGVGRVTNELSYPR